MDEIEVEAVDSLDPGITVDTAEYVLYGGKGGVGKTTMAAATAVASASDGTNTLVVSTDPAHSLSDTLEAEIPSRPHRIRENVPLWAVEIDPDDALDRTGMFGQDGALSGTLETMLGGDAGAPGGGDGSAAMMPGADEAAAMQLLLEYLDDDRFDRVVVDTAPTGHTLRLLELPEVMDSMVGQLMQVRERLGGMMDGLTGMFGGDDDASAEQTMGDLDAVKERVEQLRAVLTDPQRTDFRVVLVPEELSVAESNRLITRLDEYGVPVNTVVVNRVMEPLADVADVPADAFVAPNHEDCAFCARRWDVQQQALADAQDIFRGHTVKRVPLLAEEVRGERPLRVVAACLA
ncbi:ArsA family ATPase [Halobacterium salinarum]|uniref:ArsA family ATPase n=4 Tax=Halobacterium salinarum TaxID=2242 RepID=Q9HS79_HALSA|nr:ArsA family ATPase [Halobacterium salinarum]AAG18929.1 arsenical pump-driving ATPase [Halobacterium salinarum NRC-1]MBB6089761.1 arsenite-transporting ATPase [Halobacterium salinarum]MCF2206837.1 ArsA family ATPase [Halobacterium salinarum]MDL0120097.1 ArsA family ATPase [Halobacterium salinarum]MDL0124088.1 ArsA family ATPase [Halobacterium salinarum]